MKPDRGSLACIRDMLARETELARQLDDTRGRLVTCLDQARGEGGQRATWTTIARAIIARPASVAEIRRVASRLETRARRR